MVESNTEFSPEWDALRSDARRLKAAVRGGTTSPFKISAAPGNAYDIPQFPDPTTEIGAPAALADPVEGPRPSEHTIGDNRHVRGLVPDIIVGNGVAELLGEDARLVGVRRDNGTELPCPLAIVAVGVSPDVELAQAAWIAIGEMARIRARRSTVSPCCWGNRRAR
jgi:hypothetical protein